MGSRSVRLFVVVLALAAAYGRVAIAGTTFYEAYQNGLAREKEGAWKEAREHFLRASELRPTPGRRVKSYGLNFLEPYDPAIHLARASYHLGLLDEARRHLQIARSAAVSPEAEIAELSEEIEAARPRATSAVRPTVAPTETPSAMPAKPERPLPTEGPPDVSARGSAPSSNPASGTVPEADAPRAGADPGRTATRTASPPAEPAGPVAAPTETLAGKPAGPSAREGAVDVPGATTGVPTPVPAGTASGAPTGAARRARETVRWGPVALAASVLALFVLVATRVALGIRERRRASVPIAGTEVFPPGPAPAPEPDEGTSRATSILAAGTGSSPSGNRPVTAAAAGARALRAGADPRFGAYELEGILGRGGMGTTYVARRLRDGFPVALKVPHEHILEEPEFVERFLREGALGALLRHPNIVRIYEAGAYDERPFIAMELVPGTTLERVLRKEHRLPLVRALQVARGIALALDYAHLKGIVHRDLKPENVMVLPDGEVKVMDYGIARRMDVAGLTASDVYLGTPHYSAPESLVPSEVGPQSDLYSLGVLLFRMLSGALPHSAPTPFELLHKHAYEPLPPLPPELGVLPEVYGLLMELTAKSKQERYASAELFLRDLDQILNRL